VYLVLIWFSQFIQSFFFSISDRVPLDGEDKPRSAVLVDMALHNEFVGDVRDIAVGSIVSYKHVGNYSGIGKPLNPKIVSVRLDIQDWKDVLAHQKMAFQLRKGML
jgi:hypothetical protein